MIRVLHIVSALSGGGVEMMLYNYYKNINKELIHFDFIVHGDNKGSLEDKFETMNSSIFHVIPKKQSLVRNILSIKEIIKSGNYDVVHAHQNLSAGFTLLIAKFYRVPVRIVHAHGCRKEKKFGKVMKNNILRLLNILTANYFFACGSTAGKWLYGRFWNKISNKKIIYNAIDLNRFTYLEEIRGKYRKAMALENKFVVLHVGRFDDGKNHRFLIDIFQSIVKIDKEAILVLVGSGPTEEEIKNIVSNKNLNEHIKFLENRSDIAELMNAADVLAFPSKYEGLGIVTIEAQATGLNVIASNNVPRDTSVTNLIEYLSLDLDAEVWAEKILSLKQNLRVARKKEMQRAGYDIGLQAKEYEKWLLTLFKYRKED